MGGIIKYIIACKCGLFSKGFNVVNDILAIFHVLHYHHL